MKRILLVALLTVALFAGAAFYYFLQPVEVEDLPLAGHVPADAVAYAGFADYRELDRLPESIAGEIRGKIAESESYLAGPVAFYLDREREWVFLARLTRAARVFSGGQVVDGAAVIAQTPEALERHKTKTGSLRDHPGFKELNSKLFVNLEPLRLPGRLRDFSAAGFELEPGPALTLRGRALYRGGVFRLYVEHYLHAARPAPPTGEAPVAVTFTEHFPRLWDEITHDLSPADRERLRQGVFVLNRDFLNGRGMRDFLGRIGPACGLSIVPTAHPYPALVGWIDVPGEEDRKTLSQMLHKATYDVVQYYRDKGEAPPFDTTADEKEALWHVRIRGQEAYRLGEAFSPAYAIRENRLLFTTCASALEPGGEAAGGTHHGNAAIDVAPVLDLLRALAPIAADEAFREEAERQAEADFRNLYGPGGLAALRRTIPDASTRAKFLSGQRAQLTAKALGELSQTPRYRRELDRRRNDLEALGRVFGELKRVSAKGRFTSEGLRLEIRAESGEEAPAPAPR